MNQTARKVRGAYPTIVRHRRMRSSINLVRIEVNDSVVTNRREQKPMARVVFVIARSLINSEDQVFKAAIFRLTPGIRAFGQLRGTRHDPRIQAKTTPRRS